jgi:hypothetical protein
VGSEMCIRDRIWPGLVGSEMCIRDRCKILQLMF